MLLEHSSSAVKLSIGLQGGGWIEIRSNGKRLLAVLAYDIILHSIVQPLT